MPSASPGDPRHLDAESIRWLEGLREAGAPHDKTLAELHARLLRVARHELGRRRHALGSISGPELDDVAQQSADDALLKITANLDGFRGASRFTTWAYKFVIFEVSGKVARHAWRRHPPDEEPAWEHLPDPLAPRPADTAVQREQLTVLASALNTQLTVRQREVFVAVALNDASIDVLAVKLGSNRNAVYKNLFDARRKLRRCLATAGHPLTAAEEHA
jgi:RNA polymerase sigma-70 factor, ECF subfamily